jgi:hypothetical protein
MGAGYCLSVRGSVYKLSLKRIAGGVLSGIPKLSMNRLEGKIFFRGAERGGNYFGERPPCTTVERRFFAEAPGRTQLPVSRPRIRFDQS